MAGVVILGEDFSAATRQFASSFKFHSLNVYSMKQTINYYITF